MMLSFPADQGATNFVIQRRSKSQNIYMSQAPTHLQDLQCIICNNVKSSLKVTIKR